LHRRPAQKFAQASQHVARRRTCLSNSCIGRLRRIRPIRTQTRTGRIWNLLATRWRVTEFAEKTYGNIRKRQFLVTYLKQQKGSRPRRPSGRLEATSIQLPLIKSLTARARVQAQCSRVFAVDTRLL